MFRIKICGLTSGADARAVGLSGADAVGLNFYPHSRRFVSVEVAEQILAELPGEIQRVGVFVNATDDEVCRIYDHLQLDLIQLHGDEPPEYLLSLGGRPVLRAFRLGPGGVAPIVQYLDECRTAGAVPKALLVDAHQPGTYGGTGHTADWSRLAEERNALPPLPLVLAGGLTPTNVADAVRTVAPAAVDACSGVEIQPGKKDPRLVEQFVRAADRALGELLQPPSG
ncbi:MAG: phosphoribosylanthranilate isomerase [Planctomycetales bacterium]|nr:phosphoribosylanthranilate isomerase [Planctomycetales bacterium]